jgi:hypothetical protein
VVVVLLSAPRPAPADSDWRVSLYGGQFIGAGNGDMVHFRFSESYLLGLGLTYEFAESPPHVRWEVEGQGLQHMDEQEHTELALAVGVRWVTFPWNQYVDTSLGFGAGLSYATEEPEVEARENPSTGATRLLHSLILEVAVAPPGASRWSLVGRIHHRSGVWGLFDGVGSASNFFVVGIRYRF